MTVESCTSHLVCSDFVRYNTSMTDNVTGADNQQERLLTNEQKCWFLAGLVEGEGSICVSIKAHPTARFGFLIQPAFYIYQHRERRALLDLAKEVFQVGAIWPKPGNEVVLVYGIYHRRYLDELVIPFFERYMAYSRGTEDFRLFKQIVEMVIGQHHLNINGMLEIIDLAYNMNISAKSKGRKRSKEEVVKRILRDYTPDVTTV
jgi:hypothetical protein